MQGPGFNPWSRNQIPHATAKMWCSWINVFFFFFLMFSTCCQRPLPTLHSAWNTLLHSRALVLVTVCVCSVTQFHQTLLPHGPWPIRLFCPWNFPDKNTGVGCRFLFQGNPPDLGIEPKSLVSPTLASGFFTTTATCLKVKWSCSVVSDSLQPHGL